MNTPTRTSSDRGWSILLQAVAVASRCSISSVCVISGILFFFVSAANLPAEMTLAKFRKIASSDGDAKAMRPELSKIPIWKESDAELKLNYADGRTILEKTRVTTKTVEGNYIVYSGYSTLYKTSMSSIIGYDEDASSITQWGVFGDVLVKAIIVRDDKNKTSASFSQYGDGYEEIATEHFSEAEITGHAKVFKDGVLFMTREIIARPVTAKEATTAPDHK